MIIPRKDIDSYKDAFLKILNKKIDYLKSMALGVNERKKPVYGYVPKKIAESVSGSNKYLKELELLEMIKSEYLHFCDYDLSPFKFNNTLLDNLSCLYSTLTDEEKSELFLLLNESVEKINRQRIDEFLELESHLLFSVDSNNSFNFGQNIIEADSLNGVLPESNAVNIINNIGKNKVDDYKKTLGDVKSLIQKKDVPLGEYGMYKLLDDVEMYISSDGFNNHGGKFDALVINFDYIKNCIIVLERLSNCNDYLLSILEMLKDCGEIDLKNVIDYLEELLKTNTIKYNQLSESISGFPLEDIVSETYKNKNIFDQSR